MTLGGMGCGKMGRVNPLKKNLNPQKLMKWGFDNPRRARRMFNMWPPLRGAGLVITDISSDWSYGRLEHRRTLLNPNMNGSVFGGTLFAMTDVLFGTLVKQRLGDDFEVWTRTGTFQFLAPGGHGTYLDVHASDELMDWVEAVIVEDGYCNIPYTSVVKNPDGTVAGIGQQDLHARPRKGRRPDLVRAKNPEHAKTPRGLVLESIATAVVWHCFQHQPETLTKLMSAQRRIPDPEDQMHFVCAEALEQQAATRAELRELGVPTKYLG